MRLVQPAVGGPSKAPNRKADRTRKARLDSQFNQLLEADKVATRKASNAPCKRANNGPSVTTGGCRLIKRLEERLMRCLTGRPGKRTNTGPPT